MAITSINPQFVVDEKGHAKSVLLSVADYRRLLEHLEDLEDALALDESVRTAKGFRNYSEIRAELRKTRRL
jgi:PHD/YefM family antitoxin component YafN of YafNO toxin-antitoxin module